MKLDWPDTYWGALGEFGSLPQAFQAWRIEHQDLFERLV